MQLGGNHGGGEAQAGQLGNVPGQVAHALQRSAHPQRAHDHAQVAGHGPLQRQDVDGALVQVVLQEVDAGVGGDDFLGQFDVGAVEGSRGLRDGLADQLGDLDELFAHLGEFGLENFTHVCVLSSEILPATSSGGPISVHLSALQLSSVPAPVNCDAPIGER